MRPLPGGVRRMQLLQPLPKALAPPLGPPVDDPRAIPGEVLQHQRTCGRNIHLEPAQHVLALRKHLHGVLPQLRLVDAPEGLGLPGRTPHGEPPALGGLGPALGHRHRLLHRALPGGALMPSERLLPGVAPTLLPVDVARRLALPQWRCLLAPRRLRLRGSALLLPRGDARMQALSELPLPQRRLRRGRLLARRRPGLSALRVVLLRVRLPSPIRLLRGRGPRGDGPRAGHRVIAKVPRRR
mmetsp:Transcript_62495/g.179722  ORF Transcript_62495/g.179722 Transcript_62495/m.179722 type:complete len:241 (-) Transcript_62495:947-1669(-)